MSDFERALQLAHGASLAYVSSLGDRRVSASASLEELRIGFATDLNSEPMDPAVVVSELIRSAEPGLIGTAGGRFFGWVIGGSLPSALAADWMAAAWDQNPAAYACSPAGAVVEEIAGAWLKEVLRLPADASFAFVTGCNMAHATCLAAARHSLLGRRGWDVEKKGLAGSPPIRILTSAMVHGSFVRAARFVGLGTDAIVKLESDDGDRLSLEALRSALAASDLPTIVLLQAGDINIAAFDDFESLIPLSHGLGAWVHIDGAFGLWASASSTYRHFLNGAEQADSWATDGHKWLNVPYDSGYAFVRDSAAHRASMAHTSAYVDLSDGAREPMDWNPEWSRRARGLATYAALRQLGKVGLEEMIDRCCRCCLALVDGIGALPGAEVLWRPHLNQGLLRFGGSDDVTTEVIDEIQRRGRAFFTGTTWRGMRAMRVSVSNWQTDSSEVAIAIDAVREVLELHG